MLSQNVGVRKRNTGTTSSQCATIVRNELPVSIVQPSTAKGSRVSNDWKEHNREQEAARDLSGRIWTHTLLMVRSVFLETKSIPPSMQLVEPQGKPGHVFQNSASFFFMETHVIRVPINPPGEEEFGG